MGRVYLRFYEELNDFLPIERRKVEFEHTLNRRTSIKDLIESLGIPHTEIEIILANGRSVDFDYIVQENDRISVYPMFECFDIEPLLRLRPKPLRDPRFILDTNLGRLARYLRLLGFDCLYRNDYEDGDVAKIASQQHRIVLTRDRFLLRRKIITRGYFVRSVHPREQVKEVLQRLDLYRSIAPFTRCARCNGALIKTSKDAVIDRLEPLTKLYYNDFRICLSCNQIYWSGSHQDRARQLINELTSQNDQRTKNRA
ncbi:MAG: Mut7-C ubiquitin/RNAse domain-containing protein [Gammaproteobacteria bacterium]|nr:Mut7-C ubiquitin/RNAse domain-containing protein [Gammaproteobacteria bacterium]